MRIYFGIILLSVIICAPLSAKNLVIQAISPIHMTRMLESQIKLDLNGDSCLLLKIGNLGEECKFEGAVVDAQYSGMYYYVNLSRQSSKFNLKCPGFESLPINLNDYMSKEEMKNCKVLSIDIIKSSDEANNVVPGNFFVLSVDPIPSDTTNVFIDGKKYTTDDGHLIEFLTPGTHRYEVNAPGFKTVSGFFTIKNSENSVVNVSLESEKSKLRVKCDSPGATVFINGIKRGYTDWDGELSAGEYFVEVTMVGNAPYTSSISIGKNEVKDIIVPAFKVYSPHTAYRSQLEPKKTHNQTTVSTHNGISNSSLQIDSPRTSSLNYSQTESGRSSLGIISGSAYIPNTLKGRSSTSSTTRSQANGHEYVDLGLPSGTLWATCNIGATKPGEYGSYFSWGQIEPTSQYIDGRYDIKFAIAGNNNYDPAASKWGENWSLPTQQQAQELIDNCSWETAIRDGKTGCLITGRNGNSIFIPYAGEIDDPRIPLYGPKPGDKLELWLDETYKYSYREAYALWADKTNHKGNISPHNKRKGLSIRPVMRKQ